MNSAVFGLTFRLFSFYHIGALVVIPLLGFFLFHFREAIRQKRINRVMRGAFFLTIVINELSAHIWLIVHHQWSVTWSLPLQLCDVSAILSAILLLNKNFALYELVYFWGLGGALQALLTPDMGRNPVPLFLVFQFFISHSMIIITSLFFTFVERFRPSVKSIGRTMVVTNFYAAFIGLFNLASGANYLYLFRKPAAPSLLDYLGPWPWYIGSLELVLVVVCVLLYFPFVIIDRFKQRKKLLSLSKKGNLMSAPFWETILISTTGGLSFQLMHSPLPWMLGPLTFVLVWIQLFKRKTWWPIEIRNGALVILGYMIGNSFSPGTAAQIMRQLPAMLMCTVATVFVSLLIGFITSRKTGMTLSSSIIGSIPGGLTQMVTLSEEIKGADFSGVIFLQTVRLLSVVFVVPFLVIHGMAGSVTPGTAGATSWGWDLTAVTPVSLILYTSVVLTAAWLAVRLKMPTPFLTGPIFGAALLNMLGGTGPEVPRLLLIAAQLSMGAYMGQRMELSSLSNWKKMLPYTLAGSLGLVLFSLGLGELLSMFHSINLVSAFLGTAPGGIAEMGVTAIQVHADLSLVSAYQMFRVFFILFVVPPVLKRLLGRIAQEKGGLDN